MQIKFKGSVALKLKAKMGKTRNSSDFLARRGCSLQTHHFQHLRHWLPSWGRPALQCQVSCETKTSIQQQSCGQKKKKKPSLFAERAVLTIWGAFTPQYFCDIQAFHSLAHTPYPFSNAYTGQL